MTKIITINSCRECPCCEVYHHHRSVCHRYNLVIDKIDTIHPECKLNDLPSVEEIRDFAVLNAQSFEESDGILKGANFVINKINQ